MHSECILPQNQDPRVAEKSCANLGFGICQNTLTNPYQNSLGIQDFDQESCGNLGSWFLQRMHSECIPSECRMPQVQGRIKINILLTTLCVCIHICIYMYIYICIYICIYIYVVPLEGKPIPKTLQNCPFKTIPKNRHETPQIPVKVIRRYVFFGYHIYIYIYQWVKCALW